MRRACPAPPCIVMSTFCLLPGCSHALFRTPHISSAVSETPTDNSRVRWRSDHAAGAVALWLVLRGHGLQCSLIDILRTAGPSASAEQLLRQAASVTPFATIERLRPRDLPAGLRFSFCSTTGATGVVLRRRVVSSLGMVSGIVLVTGKAGDELVRQPTSKGPGGALCPPGRRLIE